MFQVSPDVSVDTYTPGNSDILQIKSMLSSLEVYVSPVDNLLAYFKSLLLHPDPISLLNFAELSWKIYFPLSER